MIKIGNYVRRDGKERTMRVIGVQNRKPSGEILKVPTARCRYKSEHGGFPLNYYETAPLAELTVVDVVLRCDVCGEVATYDNGRAATRFLCDKHARPTDHRFPR
mgnify:CR=1 FL=1